MELIEKLCTKAKEMKSEYLSHNTFTNKLKVFKKILIWSF